LNIPRRHAAATKGHTGDLSEILAFGTVRPEWTYVAVS
jgi:hypothetical protein